MLLTPQRSSNLRLFALLFALVAGLTIALGAMLSAAQAAPVGMLKEFRVPTDNSEPRYIAEGSDGNLWFTEGADFFTPNPDPNTGGTFHNQIGRITPTGTIDEFRVDGCQCFLNDIVQGPGGVLYFTTNSNRLGRITTAEGTVQPFIETPFVVGDALVRRGDDLWINDFNTGSIWRYNIPTGAFTEFPTGLTPLDVAVDPNGIVWFTDAFDGSVDGQIGRLNPRTGRVTAIDVDGFPRQIDVATDGAVWFTERFTPQAVGRINPVRNPTPEDVTFFPADGGPEDIAPAADGSMWFTRTTAGNIARISPDGTITAQSKAVRDSEPFGITVASNGDPWFTMMSANKIATFELR
jgi:streptogramin lyase